MAENKAPLQKRDWVPSRKTSRQAKKATKKDDTTSKLHRVDHFFIHSWGRETLLLLKMNQDGGIENTGKIADPYQLVGCLSKLEPHKDIKTFSALNWCFHFSFMRTRRSWVKDRMVPFPKRPTFRRRQFFENIPVIFHGRLWRFLTSRPSVGEYHFQSTDEEHRALQAGCYDIAEYFWGEVSDWRWL